MGFLLHLLRPGDLFADVGAHLGGYTVLAAAAVGARAVAFEPAPDAYAALLDNIHLNRAADRVVANQKGCAGQPGRLWFTAGLDAKNHVYTGQSPPDGKHHFQAEVVTLDEAINGEVPALIKIDTEGYKQPV